MNQIIEQENINIEDLIFEIRGKQVMLDSDLAHIYHCKNGTKSINLAVNRNKAKFPDDFYFQLTEAEYQKLRFQSETTNKMSRTLPYTQEGVAMLATVLRTSIASKVSVDIMRAFIKMKRFINYTLDNQNHINNLVFDNYESIKIINQDIKILQDSYNELISKKKVNQIYFNGEYYDAYSNIIDIFKECKEELIIIDSYSDKYTLDLISKIKINVILITTNKLLNKTDITNYNKQYNNLTIIYNNTFHDRYFILDRDIIFHCGTSLNHIGSKTFSINILDDIEIKEALLNKLNSIIC